MDLAELGKDLVADPFASVRLRRRPSQASIKTIGYEHNKSNHSDRVDLDQLDDKHKQLSAQINHDMIELRKNPNNKLLYNQITENMESLALIKDWTSLVKTDDGMAVVKEQMKSQRQREINQRKYEIDEVLKISKAQSATDICFLVDCTRSMKKYIAATKTQIHQLTDTIIQLYAIKPRLAFIGYRDTDTDPEQLDFTDDVDTFYIFLEQLKLTSGHDRCEDIFGKSALHRVFETSLHQRCCSLVKKYFDDVFSH